MRIALIADIHGNLTALEAVLADARKQGAQKIFSLGDQIGYGPYPLQVMQCLQAEGILCLMGNHEDRQVALRKGQDRAVRDDVNYAFVRWTEDQLRGLPLALPLTLSVGNEDNPLLLAHASVNNPYAWAEPGDPQKLIQTLKKANTEVMAIGHCHGQHQFVWQGKTLVCVGSAGMFEERGGHVPAVAAYTMATADRGSWSFEPRQVTYDTSPLARQMIARGLVAADPVMARLVHHTMVLGVQCLVQFLQVVKRYLGQQGEQRISPQVWQEAANHFDWPEGPQQCKGYWQAFE